MGRVYLGLDRAGRQVAIKVIRVELANIPEYLDRFREEAANAQRIARLHTAQVLDFDADADCPYLVTEFVEGPTLARRVRERGPLFGFELDQLAFVMATAIEAMHAAGVVHRDLRPQNVILSPTGPRVIDFGVARATEVDAVLDVVRRLPFADDEHLRAAATVADQVQRLRATAEANGLAHRWSFDAALGARLDGAAQRPFGACDPDRPVRLVVFPAFLVENSVLLRQRVYTGD